MSEKKRKSITNWNGRTINPGETADVELGIGESYSGMTVRIPLHIKRAEREGPTVFVTAALHGDEINGTGAVRSLIQDETLNLVQGCLVLVPVLNLLAFDRHSRYLPDRRDLNRCFPGSRKGSLASRMARKIFQKIVTRCDYGIDLHTAAVRRTNYPNVRADMEDPEVRRIAEAFGSEIILDGKGPKGCFRRESCRSGCPTIVMEGGEVWKVEPSVVESGVRGVKNVLRELGMLDSEPQRPEYRLVLKRSKWVRADYGGFLQFHVKPGEAVEQGQALATNTNLLGHEANIIYSPFTGVVMGMTTLPAVSPGEPICNIGKLPKDTLPKELRRLRKDDDGFKEDILSELASNVMVTEPTEDPEQSR